MVSKNKNNFKNIRSRIYDSSWYDFIFKLSYKLSETGGILYIIDKYYPSSKLCSQCGSLKDLELKDRDYICENCNYIGDRDVNAAINILNKALLKL
jgi:putative transposase